MAKKKSLLNIDFISSDWIINNLLYFLFLGFLATIYIANAHYAERNVREIQMLQKEIKDLRWEFRSIQASNMYERKRSEIYEKVKNDQLRSSSEEIKILEIAE